MGGVFISTGIVCENNGDCEEEEELCEVYQLDINENGIGDACECYADCDNNTIVDMSDLILMKSDFNRNDCNTTPCNADLNDDDVVDMSDLILMKVQYGKSGCPVIE